MGTLGGPFVDHRAQGRVFRLGVTQHLGLDFGDDEIAQLVEDAAVRDDSLHRDAGLAGLADPERCDACRGALQVGGGVPVGADDDCGVASELEGDVLAGHTVADAPADGSRPGEGHDR